MDMQTVRQYRRQKDCGSGPLRVVKIVRDVNKGRTGQQQQVEEQLGFPRLLAPQPTSI